MSAVCSFNVKRSKLNQTSWTTLSESERTAVPAILTPSHESCCLRLLPATICVITLGRPMAVTESLHVDSVVITRCVLRLALACPKHDQNIFSLFVCYFFQHMGMDINQIFEMLNFFQFA